jgi:hypothetical protein
VCECSRGLRPVRSRRFVYSACVLVLLSSQGPHSTSTRLPRRAPRHTRQLT